MIMIGSWNGDGSAGAWFYASSSDCGEEDTAGVEGEYAGVDGEYAGVEGLYDGVEGLYDGVEGEYDGEVGEYEGEVGEYDGEVGEYEGDYQKKQVQDRDQNQPGKNNQGKKAHLTPHS